MPISRALRPYEKQMKTETKARVASGGFPARCIHFGNFRFGAVAILVLEPSQIRIMTKAKKIARKNLSVRKGQLASRKRFDMFARSKPVM
jgi:hypothetical protein